MKIKRNICALCLAALTLATILPAPRTSAYTQADLNNINSKISELRAQMNVYEQQASAYAAEANSIQAEINSLQAQQSALKTQIELKEAERQQLIIEIETITQRINTNSDTVGYTIAQFYYNDEISTLERMASSDSFSSFIDEEMQMSSVSDTLSEIIEENKNLKAELETKKKNAELILKDLTEQKNQLAQLELEQAVLLAQTRENENSYRQMKSDVASQKAAL
jgi:peptidoglycan hydrolase CwlO-like protein